MGPSPRSCLQQDLSNVLDNGGAGQLAHADTFGLLRGYAQRHLVLREVENKQFQTGPSNRLNFDRDDLADAVGGVYDEFVRAKSGSIVRPLYWFTVRFDEIGFRLVSLVRVVETMPLML